MSKHSKLFLLVVMIVICIVSFMQFNLFGGKAQENISVDEAKTFTMNYFTSRANAVLNENKLDSYFSSKNSNLKEFEINRVNFYKNLPGSWEGTLLGINSCPYTETITIDNQSSTVKEEVYEWITIKWHSKKVQLPDNFEELKEVKELRNLEMAKPELKEAIEDKIAYIIKGYTDYPEIVDTGIGVKHEITLTKENGKLVILKDAYDEGPDLTTSPDFIKAENKPTQDKNVSQVSTLSTISYYYDRQNAADYADGHVYHYCGCDPYTSPYYPSSYNPCYKNFAPPNGNGDCANFVSQCLFTGGQPRVFDDGTYPTGINPWYYKNNGTCDISDDKCNSAWTVAPTLYNIVIASNRGTSESYSIACMGDIAFYNGDSYHGHAVFIAVTGNSGNPDLYDSHTNDRYHCPLPNNTGWSYEWIYGGSQSINY